MAEDEKPVQFKLAIVQIENGYTITRKAGTVYREELIDAVKEGELVLADLKKQAEKD